MERPDFKKVYTQYLNEMGLTFPELEKAADLALKKGHVEFSKAVEPILHNIASRDDAIFTKEGVQIAPGVVLTKKLWKEVGKPTQKAIWDFLSSLVLLASYEQKNTVSDTEGIFDISGAEADLKKMFKDLGDQFSNKSFSGFFDGMKEAAENMKEKFGAAMGISGEMPPIPERLFKGHIAKIAEDLAKEFNPEDFGIPASMLESNDTNAIFEYLQTVFTQKPEMLMAGAKKIANRIQEKLKRGEVKREDLIKEAEELMAEFQNNPMFKEIFEQLGATLRGAGGAEGGNGTNESERRRVVQERLRKKMEARKKK
jgi:hypothetical protein